MSKEIEYTLKISLEIGYGNVSITCESDDEDAPYISGFGKSLNDALDSLSRSIDDVFEAERSRK